MRAADPAGGGYAVEKLTSELADAAWAEFQRIEAAGGIAAALADGSWRSRIAATAAERRRRIATRRQPITGVSEFPIGRRDSCPSAAGPPVTERHRPVGGAVRELPRHPGDRAGAVLLTVGTAPTHGARRFRGEPAGRGRDHRHP